MTVAANILASLAASQAALSQSQTQLTEAFGLVFGSEAKPSKPSTNAPTPRKPKADAPSKPQSNKSAKAEAKAAKRNEMRAKYGADWHKTYTLHPVTLEARLRSGAEEPKAEPVKPKAPVKPAEKAKARRKATGKLAQKLAEKATA